MRWFFGLLVGLGVAVIVVDRYEPGTLDQLINAARSSIDHNQPGTTDRLIADGRNLIDGIKPGLSDRVASDTTWLMHEFQGLLPAASTTDTKNADALDIFEGQMLPIIRETQNISVTYESAERLGRTGFILKQVVLRKDDQVNKIDSLELRDIDVNNFKPGGRPSRVNLHVEGYSPDPTAQLAVSQYLGATQIKVNFTAAFELSDDGTLNLREASVDLPGLASLQLQAVVTGLPPIGKTFEDTDPNEYYVRQVEVTYADSSLLSRVTDAIKKENGKDPDAKVAEYIQTLKDAPADGARDEGAGDLITFLTEYKHPKGSLKITFNPTGKLSVMSLDFEKIVLSFFEGTAAKDFGAKISYGGPNTPPPPPHYKPEDHEALDRLINNPPSSSTPPDDSAGARKVVIDTYLMAACQQAWNQIVEKSGPALRINRIPDAGIRTQQSDGRIEYQYGPAATESASADAQLKDVDLCGVYILSAVPLAPLARWNFAEMQREAITTAETDIQNFVDPRYGGRWNGTAPLSAPDDIEELAAALPRDLSVETAPPSIPHLHDRFPVGSPEYDLGVILARFQVWLKQASPIPPSAQAPLSAPPAPVQTPTPTPASDDGILTINNWKKATDPFSSSSGLSVLGNVEIDPQTGTRLSVKIGCDSSGMVHFTIGIANGNFDISTKTNLHTQHNFAPLFGQPGTDSPYTTEDSYITIQEKLGTKKNVLNLAPENSGTVSFDSYSALDFSTESYYLLGIPVGGITQALRIPLSDPTVKGLLSDCSVTARAAAQKQQLENAAASAEKARKAALCRPFAQQEAQVVPCQLACPQGFGNLGCREGCYRRLHPANMPDECSYWTEN